MLDAVGHLMESAVFWQIIAGALVGGLGAYIAIRVALARLEERVRAVETALESAKNTVTRAHERIDDIQHSMAHARARGH